MDNKKPLTVRTPNTWTNQTSYRKADWEWLCCDLTKVIAPKSSMAMVAITNVALPSRPWWQTCHSLPFSFTTGPVFTSKSPGFLKTEDAYPTSASGHYCQFLAHQTESHASYWHHFQQQLVYLGNTVSRVEWWCCSQKPFSKSLPPSCQVFSVACYPVQII